MDIDKNSLYYQHISNRSFLHFIIGLYPRLIQYIKLNKAQKKAIKQGANIGENTIIIKELACRANTNLTIGENSSIGSYKIDLRSPVHIGNNVIISNGCEIITTSHYIDSPEWEHKYYGLEIEDYVWIASNVLILPSCRRIGKGAVIGAGSVVVKDVPPMAVMGGNPAQCLKTRKNIHSKLVIASLLSGDLKIYWNIWINRKK